MCIRDSLEEVIRLRSLKASHVCATEVVELAGVHRDVVDNDAGHHGFAPLGVSAPDHRDLRNGGMSQQHLLHLARVDVGTAGDDDVLGPVLEGEVALVVETPHVSSPEPAIADGRVCCLLVTPVAHHHDVAAHHYLPSAPWWHRPAAGVDHSDVTYRKRLAHAGDPTLPTRVAVVGDDVMAERGDGHRRLALTVNLGQAVAHGFSRANQVIDVHRAAAVDNRPERRGAFDTRTRLGDVGDEPVDDGGCGEQRHVPQRLGNVADLCSVEPPAGREDVPGAVQHEDGTVDAGTVRHWSRVNRAVVRADGVDLHVVAEGQGQQLTVSEHDAFRPPGRA